MTSTDWEREIEELSWGGSIRRSSLSREIIRKPNQQNWTEWLIRRRVWQLIGWREVSGRTSGSWFRLDEWMGKAVKRGGIEWGGVWDNGICRTSGECSTGTYMESLSHAYDQIRSLHPRPKWNLPIGGLQVTHFSHHEKYWYFEFILLPSFLEFGASFPPTENKHS